MEDMAQPPYLPDFPAPARYAEYPNKGFIVEDGNRDALQAVTEFNGSGVLFLHGDVGAGKTHLAMIAADRVIQSGGRAAFIFGTGLGRLKADQLPSADAVVVDGIDIAISSTTAPEHFRNLTRLIENALTKGTAVLITSIRAPQEAVSAVLGDHEASEAVLGALAAAQVLEVRGKDRRIGSSV